MEEEGSAVFLLSPSNVRELRQFFSLFNDPMDHSGIVAPSFRASVSIHWESAASFPPGASGVLSGVRFRVDDDVPLGVRQSEDFIWLPLRLQGRILMWD